MLYLKGNLYTVTIASPSELVRRKNRSSQPKHQISRDNTTEYDQFGTNYQQQQITNHVIVTDVSPTKASQLSSISLDSLSPSPLNSANDTQTLLTPDILSSSSSAEFLSLSSQDPQHIQLVSTVLRGLATSVVKKSSKSRTVSMASKKNSLVSYASLDAEPPSPPRSTASVRRIRSNGELSESSGMSLSPQRTGEMSPSSRDRVFFAGGSQLSTETGGTVSSSMSPSLEHSHNRTRHQLPPLGSPQMSENGEYYRSAAQDLLSVVEGPIRQLAFEIKGAMLATGIAATCYLLKWFQAVLVPFFLAVFLMYLVDPIVEAIDVSPKYFLCICTSRGRHARRTSRGCSRAFASLCAVSLVCSFFGVLGYITVLSVQSLDINAYQSGYNHFVDGTERFVHSLGIPLNITTTLHDNVERLARMILIETMDLGSVMFITMIYLTYFLCTRTRASDAGGVWSKIDSDIQRFVMLKCILSLFVALLVTVVYVSLNVGLAVVWGILTFLLNWIPNMGAILASFLPIMIIAITPSDLMNPMEKVSAMLLPMCFHLFVGNFIEPKVFGKKLEMDPVVVIFSLSVWGLLWGVVGMMLSVPLTAAAKIMLSHLKLWPQLVALLEGTYFSTYGMKVAAFKKRENDIEYKTMEVRTES